MGDRSDNIAEKFARFGIGSKGVVYCLVGMLAFMTAFGYGGKKTGSTGVLDYIASMAFGNILLFIVGIGLLAYAAWRFYQTFADEKNKGSDKKGLAWRTSYLISGLLYGYVAIQAFMVIFANEKASGGNSKEQAASSILTEPLGQVLLVVVAILIFAKAGYQIYKVYSGKYKENLKHTELSKKERKTLITAGKTGLLSRGIVIAVVAYFFFKAAFSDNASQAGGTKEALKFLHESLGSIGFALIASGLFAYGIYLLLRAKYRDIRIQ